MTIKKQRKILLVDNNKSCRGCYYEIKGLCYWFKEIENSSPKTIPANIVNKGCSKYYNTNLKKILKPITEKVIKMFKGEIISNKYRIKKDYYYKPYKKKSYKSSHNYTHRKDAQ